MDIASTNIVAHSDEIRRKLLENKDKDNKNKDDLLGGVLFIICLFLLGGWFYIEYSRIGSSVDSRSNSRSLSVMCCYYRQHYHNAYCATSEDPNSFGCIITEALIGGPPTVLCSANNNCLPPDGMQGYWLEGFELNCDQCIQSD